MTPLRKRSLSSLAVAAALFVALLGTGFGLNQGLCGDICISESDGVGQNGPEQRVEPEFSIGAWFATSVWKHISAVDGQRCPSEPTCSAYSAQAFRNHGFFIGWVMTVDRLIHEADEGRNSPIVKRHGEFKIFDPVSNNDFWWYKEDAKTRD